MNINLNLLILITIFIIFINNFYYKNINKIENFSNSINDEEVKQIRNESFNSNFFDNLSELKNKLENIESGESVENLKISGTLNLIPIQKNIIVAFFHEVIPSGWAECNGSTVKNSHGDSIITPDLRGRFILGTNYNSYSNNNIAKFGGEEQVQLEERHYPRHRHQIGGDNHTHQYLDAYFFWRGKYASDWPSGKDNNTYGQNLGWNQENRSVSNNNIETTNFHDGNLELDTFTSINEHDHNVTAFGVENASHNNMPPYRVLKYIMKIE